MLEVAERVLGMLEGEGLVAVSCTSVLVVVVRDGRAGRAEGAVSEEKELVRLARAAWLRAGQTRAWQVVGFPPAAVGEVDRGGPLREAVATSWGTRTYETREPVELLPDRAVRRVQLDDGRILGPQAVAQLLKALGPAFGVELSLGAGPPTATDAVTLTDDGSDLHSFDAEGVPRRAVLVMQRGRFVQGVRDSAAGDSTGHATRPLTAAASARHLRLEPTTAALPPATVDDLGPLRSREARELLQHIEAVA